MIFKSGFFLSLIAIHGAAVFTQNAADYTYNPREIVGTWEALDEKGAMQLIQFQPGGFAQLTLDGKRIGGDISNGPQIKYEIDSSKTPSWLDFVLVDAKGQERGRIKSIFKMLGPKELRWEIGNPSTRPTSFSPVSPTGSIILKKSY